MPRNQGAARAVAEPVELSAQVHEFRIFTGGVETDPHRVAFWRATLTTAGLRLARDEVPPGEEEAMEVSWMELHEILGNREELYRDRDLLKEEIADLEREIGSLRVVRRRLARKCVELSTGHEQLRDPSVVEFPVLPSIVKRLAEIAGKEAPRA